MGLALIDIFIRKKIRAESPFNSSSPWPSMALTNNTDFISPLVRVLELSSLSGRKETIAKSFQRYRIEVAEEIRYVQTRTVRRRQMSDF